MITDIFPPLEYGYDELQNIEGDEETELKALLQKYSKDNENQEKYKMKPSDFESRQGYDKHNQFKNQLKMAMNDVHKIQAELDAKHKDTSSLTGDKSKSKNEADQKLNEDLELNNSQFNDENGSPLLDQTTKEKLINLGQSLDSSRLGTLNIDVRMFSTAIYMHVMFSKGYLFLEHLQSNAAEDPEVMKCMEAVRNQSNPGSIKDKLKFTYGLNKNMKIDLKRLKEKANHVLKTQDISNDLVGTEDYNEESKINSNINNSKSNHQEKPNRPDPSHGITLSELDMFDQTVNGKTMLTNTNKFDQENKLKETLQQSAVSQSINREAEIHLESMAETDMFELSEDSTMKKINGTLTSFVTTIDNNGALTFKSSNSIGMSDSMTYSHTALSFNKETSKAIPLEVIKSESGETDSEQQTPIHKNKFLADDKEFEDDDFDRFEEIDIKAVSLDNTQNTEQKKKQKALLSPEEIKKAKEERKTQNYSNDPEDFSAAKYVLQ